MRFTATEAGFKEGLGGASNSKSSEKYHYVLFGIQADLQDSENSGVYFEWDDQSNGAMNSVKEVVIGDKSVTIIMKEGESLEIKCNVSTEQWDELNQGLRTVFLRKMVTTV